MRTKFLAYILLWAHFCSSCSERENEVLTEIKEAMEQKLQFDDANNASMIGHNLAVIAIEEGGGRFVEASDLVEFYKNLIISSKESEYKIPLEPSDLTCQGVKSSESLKNITDSNIGFDYISGIKVNSDLPLPVLLSRGHGLTIDEIFSPRPKIKNSSNVGWRNGVVVYYNTTRSVFIPADKDGFLIEPITTSSKPNSAKLHTVLH